MRRGKKARVESAGNPIGPEIRQMREGLKWSVYRLAKESGVTATSIVRSEDGSREAPMYRTALRLVKAMGGVVVYSAAPGALGGEAQEERRLEKGEFNQEEESPW